MLVNIVIYVLMVVSTLAQHQGMLNTFFQYIAQLALVVATITGWLAQPTKLLLNMVKQPLGCDNIDQTSFFFQFLLKKLLVIKTHNYVY